MLDSVVKVKRLLSSNTFVKMQIWNKKIKMENLISDDLEPGSSDNETESDSDNESDNKPKKLSKKSDNETDNESGDEQFVTKS